MSVILSRKTGVTALTLALLLLGAAMTATAEDAYSGSDAEKPLEKGGITTPLLQYGYGALSSNAACSPDGTQYLTGAADGKAVLWDIDTGAVIRTFTGHLGAVRSVAFSPDGTGVLTGSADTTARLWNTATGAPVRAFAGHTSAVGAVAFSPDGAAVLTGSNDKKAKLWDAATGAFIRDFTGHTASLTSATFSPDGATVLTGAQDCKAILWNAATGTVIHTFTVQFNYVRSAAFSPDGTSILTGSGENTAKLWDTASGLLLLTFTGHTDAVSSVAFSPDGTRVLTGSDDSTAKLWNAASGAELKTLSGHNAALSSVTFSPDGTKILTGSADSSVRLWSPVSGASLHAFGAGMGALRSVAFSPDGTKVLTGSVDKTAKLWDAATASVLRTFAGHTGYVWSVAFSPDGAKVLTGSADKTARLWDMATGAHLQTFTGHSTPVLSVAFSPDGTKVIAGGSSGSTMLWNAATGAKIRSFSITSYATNSVAFSPDGTRILAGEGGVTPDQCRAVLWNAETGATIRSFPVTGSYVQSVAFSPDGTRVLTGASSGFPGSNPALHRVTLWNLETGALVQSFTGHTDNVYSVAFSPDGTRVVTGSADRTARLWNVSTGALIGSFSGYYGTAQSAVFSPDGTRVLTGTDDGIARLWNTATVFAPNVVGQSQAAATTSVTDAGLAVGAVTRQYSLTAPMGSIVSQAPAAGSELLLGETVDLVVSLGAITVPNLVGQTRTLADELLSNALLKVGAVTQTYSLSVQQGIVFSQTPPAGTAVLGGQAVDFEVSLGSITVPNLVGQTRTLAGELLSNALLMVGAVTHTYSLTVPPGIVSFQAPPAGTAALPAQAVDLEVSLGGIAVPDVVGQTQAAASASITGAGLAIGGVTQQHSLTIPAGSVISQTPVPGIQALPGVAVDLVVSLGGIAVPDVVGQAQAAASTAITGAGLAIGGVTQQHSLTVPAGSVISQAPVADTQVLPGVAVDLVVSLGGIAVPDVVGRTLVTAITTTTGAGLKVGKMTREHSLTVPAGCIISQAPAAETQVLPGAAVDLAVSRGPEFVSVPNVAGLAQEAANAILGDTHLTVGTVTPSCSNTVVEGLVIAQTPAAGGQAAPGSAVALTVSTGPCNVAVPNVAGQTVAAADAALTAAGLAVGAVTSECSNTVAAGLVIRQNPAAGTEATSGNAVVLIVSGGPCPSEGEGEVETPPTEAELRGLLTANAAMADSNGDGTISYPEALAVLPGLTTTVFNSVDTNGDGQISRAEAGLDGNNGCMGCRGGKGTITFDALRKSFGNLFLGGLSLMALRAFGRRWMQ